MLKKALKIAMLGHKRIPSREDGIEVVVKELSTRMVGLGHNITWYNCSDHHVSGKKFDCKEKTGEYKDIKLKNVFAINKKGHLFWC